MSVYQEIETPCFIIDICDIENTYRNFLESIHNVGRKDIIAYSMKANYDYKILDRLKKNGAYFETNSQFETNILKKCGVDKEKIIMNTFLKNKDHALECMNSCNFIIINSFQDLCLLADMDIQIFLGIRFNLDNIKDCNYHSRMESRFGMDIDIKNLKKFLKINKNIKIKCIHAHLSGNTRNPEIYQDMINELCRIIRELHLKYVKYIDIGGGFKIDPSFWTFSDYINLISSTLSRNKMAYLKIIYEPGNCLVRTSCTYITTVINKKKMNGKIYITVDGSSLHVNPSRTKYKPDYILPQKKHSEERQLIVGNTCKESDVLFYAEKESQLEPGDLIIIRNVGAYTLNEIPRLILDSPNIYYKI